ncbi:MAG: diacylglycerol kinase family protein [Planctomycetota bacterium]|nr:diacylglycerol kinase family protein [Planctomycetota bacterium]
MTESPWIAVQHNTMSGAGGQTGLLEELTRGLEKYGLRTQIFTDRASAQQVISDPRLRPHLRGIVAAGGDGTLLDVATRYPGVPVAILPLGTENLVARYLGIPRSGSAVADMIALRRLCQLDAARLGDHRFTVMASVGFDADVIHRAHLRRKGHITRAQYIQPILSTILAHSYPELRVIIDDQPTAVVGRIVVVANLPIYALGLNMVPTARGNDGWLDVRVFQKGSLWHVMRYLYLMQRGQHEHTSDVVKLRGKRVLIESDVAAPVQADGDPAGWTPIQIDVEPGYGNFFVPASFSADHR